MRSGFSPSDQRKIPLKANLGEQRIRNDGAGAKGLCGESECLTSAFA